jgi:3,2-trans-enoyl-CoA isomerase
LLSLSFPQYQTSHNHNHAHRSSASLSSSRRCEAISEGIKEIESTKAQAMILTSSSKVFCAGLDLTEMYQPEEQRLRDFWTAFQQVYLDLYGSRLATIAGISGPAPAAGCMLAMACDYRISNQKGIIGLNEAQFGIVAPPWMGDLMLRTVGQRQAEKALMLGTLYPAADALQIGLIDEVVEDDLVLVCEERALKWTKIPPHSRVASKMLLRKDQLDKVAASTLEDLDLFVSICSSEKVQNNLGLYLESLKKK